MSSQHSVNQTVVGDGAGTVAASPAPPDLNSGKYSFEVVQHLLDQSAHIHIMALPDHDRSDFKTLTSGGAGNVVGFRMREALHRFDVVAQAPAAKEGLRALNVVGQRGGTSTHRWMMIADDYVAVPGREPSPTAFDASQSQRFVMLDDYFKFGDDGFYGFGTGRTFPVNWDSKPQLLVGAIGNLARGFGNFAGLFGTYVFNGSFIEGQGFRGSLTCRVFDFDRKLRTNGALPVFTPIPDPEPDFTYIIWRGQKKDATQKSSLIIGSDGQPQGLRTPGQLRSVRLDFTSHNHDGLRSRMRIGEAIGKINAAILFNPLNPGAPGTAAAPIPFRTVNDYEFIDREERTITTVTARVAEGRVFNVELRGAPGQLAIRFGGFGPIESGTGPFSGVRGMLSVNSSVGISPHALSLLQLLRIYDPEGRFRSA